MTDFKNPKSIFSFTSDLNKLYCITQDDKIEELFIKIAQSVDVMVVNYLERVYQGKEDVGVSKDGDTVRTLIFLSKLKKKYGDSMSSSEYLKLFMDVPHAADYLLTIMSFNSFLSSGLRILNPFSQLISMSTVFKGSITGHKDIVATDLKKLEEGFDAYIESKTGDPYEDPHLIKQPKQNKKEKLRLMVMGLVDQFSNELGRSLAGGKFDKASQEILSNKALVNPQKLAEVVPGIGYISFPVLAQEAKSIVKDVVGRYDPHNYSFNYNYIKNRILRFSGTIDHSKYLELHNKEVMKEVKRTLYEEHPEEDSLEINSSEWDNEMSIMLLSFVLFSLSSKLI